MNLNEESRHVRRRQRQAPIASSVQARAEQQRSSLEPRIQTLKRADQIMNAVSEAGPAGISLTELADRLNLNKTTVFNLVGSLVVLGYVRKDRLSLCYHLGGRTLQLGLIARRQNALVDMCRVILERVCSATGETTSLAIPLAERAAIVDSRKAQDGSRAEADVGTSVPYHVSACGKAILAFLPRARQVELSGVAPVAIAGRSQDSLEAELRAVRAERRAYDFEGMIRGRNGVAVPVFDTDGAVCASVSVDGSSRALGKPRLDDIAGLIQSEVDRLGALCRV